jgi:hypothetical protein
MSSPIDDDRIKSRLDRIVRDGVEETLNALLDAEADRLCNAQRYAPTPASVLPISSANRPGNQHRPGPGRLLRIQHCGSPCGVHNYISRSGAIHHHHLSEMSDSDIPMVKSAQGWLGEQRPTLLASRGIGASFVNDRCVQGQPHEFAANCSSPALMSGRPRSQST